MPLWGQPVSTCLRPYTQRSLGHSQGDLVWGEGGFSIAEPASRGVPPGPQGQDGGHGSVWYGPYSASTAGVRLQVQPEGPPQEVPGGGPSYRLGFGQREKTARQVEGESVVKEVRSASSYLIDLGDGGTRHVHANQIRRFVARVTGCAVVNDNDADFGRVVTPANVVVSDLPSTRIEAAKIENLDAQQSQQLLQLLDEFADRFSDKPGLCDAAVHRIQTTSDFVPRQMRPYRVPDKFKPEVDRQIAELLEMGLIRPSDSPMASPISRAWPNVTEAYVSQWTIVICDPRTR